MQFFQSIWFEIIGVVIGLAYLFLEYRASKWLWPMGVLMPLVYVFVFYNSRFYADMGINVYYFFASIYGWFRWTKHKNDASPINITHTPARLVTPLVLVGAAAFAIIAYILVHHTDSPVPYGDSLTTALSIVGMWMLAHKYVEQWWLWFVVNIISCALYFWKGLYPTAILFIVYSVISVLGYFKWRRMMKEQMA